MSDLSRRLENIVRDGRVAELVLAPPRVRVDLAADGEAPMLTDWLPWYTPRAGAVRVWSPPSLGEQVTVLSPGGHLAAGRVLPALFSDDAPAPASEASRVLVQHGDGALFSYDAESHALQVTLPVGGKASVDAPDGITLTGDVAIEGGLTVSKDAEFAKKVVAAEDVQAAGVSLVRHPHNTTSPGAPTAPPTPNAEA
ncbi:baseplate assembly protein [Hylemonella gracilis str. Niagara R]|uniref:Baseplate assembly protein n=1 Tax=Hylemonella gracilis str. Niagara R TaxID=1458275 RepID=A0A016XIR2_9BURK|nr:baseplate assembly protein [Hylemonella gracilis str. Niagara R]